MYVHSVYECVLSYTLSPPQYRVLLCSPGGLELCSSSRRLLSAEVTGMSQPCPAEGALSTVSL